MPPKQADSNAAALNVPGAEMGKVCVRFAPEPSGYLHIGHAKSAMIDQYLKEQYDGKLIIRFDDTNPALEEIEFEESIAADLKLLGVNGDRVTHSSDYFDDLEAACEKLMSAGLLYCDDTDVDTMREERNAGIESKCRNHSVEENLRRWGEMKKGSAEGVKHCVRHKGDMQSPNKVLRDFACYRCVEGAVHHRVGDKYKAFPMYDFCCPLIDSWEGISHALRSNEYSDRIPQYALVQKMGIDHGICENTSIVYEFSRMNLVNTCLSKRKLKWIVDTGIVEGWNDPRFPTIRGILRRGMKKEALLEFILSQGASKNANLMEWDKIWAINRKILDPVVPRWAAVSKTDMVTLVINGATYACAERDLHPKNTELGKAPQHRATEVGIELEDAMSFAENEEFTLLKYSNVKLTGVEKDAEGKIVKLIGDINPDGDFKKTKKVHWVAMNAPEKTPQEVVLCEFDHVISKRKIEAEDKIEDIVVKDSKKETIALADPELKIQEDDCIQFERRGLFRCDGKDAEGRWMMIMIPDGKIKAMSAHIKGKVDVEALAKGKGGKAQAAPKPPQDDVTRILLKTGVVKDAKHHPDPEVAKLWHLTIDVGEEEPRSICSGLREFYLTAEELIGQRVVVVANLPARPMRGVDSNGMVLCAGSEDNTKVEIMQAPEGTPVGEILTFEGITGVGPDEKLPKKKSPWDLCSKEFSVKGKEGFFKNAKFLSTKGPVTCKAVEAGRMS